MDTVFNFNSRWGEKGFDENFFFFFWFLQCFHDILEVRAQAEKQMGNIIHVLLMLKYALILIVRILTDSAKLRSIIIGQ